MEAMSVEEWKEKIKEWVREDPGAMSYPYQVGILTGLLMSSYTLPFRKVNNANNYIEAMQELRNEVAT